MDENNDELLCKSLFGEDIPETAVQLGMSETKVVKILNEVRKEKTPNFLKRDGKTHSGRIYSKDIMKEASVEYSKNSRKTTVFKPEVVKSNLNGYKKIVVLPDIHYPENINLSGIEKFLADYQPDVLIYLGDILDLRYLSKFDKDNKLIARDKLKVEYNVIMKLMDKHLKLSKASDVYYLEGNHEYRIKKILESEPTGTGFIEIPKAMHLADRGIKWLEMNKWMKLGKLFFTHGLYYNMYHARKHVDTCQRNVIYGHTHTIQVHSGYHPYDKDLPHVAKSIGCLCTLNPIYMKNRPNQWINSFYIAEMESDGTFTDSIISIVNGNFRVPGLDSRRYTCSQ